MKELSVRACLICLRQKVFAGHGTVRFARVILGSHNALSLSEAGRTARLISVLTAALFCVFSSTDPVSAADNYTNWTGSKTITLNTTSSGANVAANVYNFPVLIRLTPLNFTDFANVHGAGLDIRFAKNDGTHIPYQIERYKDSGANDTAEIWVKLDTVYGNNSTQSFKMLYNNASAADSSPVFKAMVWDTSNGFLAVYHMATLPPNIVDATVRADDGLAQHSPTQVAGLIGKGLNLNRTNQQYYYSSLNEDPILDRFTFSLWFKAANAVGDTQTGEMISFGNGTTQWSAQTDRKIWMATDGTLQFGCWTGGPQVVGSADSYTDQKWHHVAAVLDPVNGQFLYIDGELINQGWNTSAQDFSSAAGGAPHFRIGGDGCGGWEPHPGTGGNDYYYKGVLDEVRTERMPRDANWIKLSYQNQMAQDKLTGMSGTVATLPGVSTAKASLLQLGAVSSNPASGSTTIRYTVPSTGFQQVSFDIYDVSGKRVWNKTVAGSISAGKNSLVWNGQNVQGHPVVAGTYYLRMTAVGLGSKTVNISKTMIVVPR
jgi:hypothetical protein